MSESDVLSQKTFPLLSRKEIDSLVEQAEEETIDLQAVFFIESEYSRVDGIDKSAVIDYSQNINTMPPLIVTPIHENDGDKPKYKIINGVHRYKALLKADQKTAKAKIINIDPSATAYTGLLMDLSYGVRHPEKDLKRMCIRLFDGDVDHSRFIREELGVPERTYYDWTKDVRKEKQAIINENLICDYLVATATQAEVAERYGYTRQRITQLCDESRQIIADLAKICIESNQEDRENVVKEIIEKLKEKSLLFLEPVTTFTPELYSVWYSHKQDHSTTHFGAFPEWMMGNILYYYTEPFDIVYDPFAGGGTTIDVCRRMIRRYYCSDLNPIGDRADKVKKWDISQGLPDDLPKPDLVFLDPPYWRQAAGKYSSDTEDLANVSLSEFYDTLTKFIHKLAEKNIKTICLVIQPTQWANENHEYEDHAIEIHTAIRDRYKIKMRLCAPYSTEQYNPNQVNIAKKERFILGRHRDIIIWELIK